MERLSGGKEGEAGDWPEGGKEKREEKKTSSVREVSWKMGSEEKERFRMGGKRKMKGESKKGRKQN